MKKIAFIFLIMTLAGCSTIHFNRSNTTTTNAITLEKWHHIGAFRLVEFSDPVNLEKQCAKMNWQSVKVEQGFLAGLVSGITSITVGQLNLGPIYSPWNVDISCTGKDNK